MQKIEEYELKRKINKFLYDIKMKTSTIGFCYWLNAISFYTLNKINANYEITNMSVIYNFVAKKYCTTVDCVEKAMRYAKENSNYKEVLQINTHMKNHEFLLYCVDRIVT